ncbi:MAG TPA: hypothetical protein VHO68_14875 [Bacteroidales bacterium]|nr:hypothetical protein [Bacteroidales bacterium]
MKIRAILTGSTGMVGEGVLKECLIHPDVEKILVVNRHPCGISHPKLTEIIHPNFLDITSIRNQLKGYNACFFCLGVSSIGMDKGKYYSVTYDVTMHFAGILSQQNPDMVFCYISGAGTDSSEKGKLHWARVKGKTENDLMKLPFKSVYNFRPGFLQPSKDLKNVKKYYNFFNILFPVLKPMFPQYVSTLKELGLAMINSVLKGYKKHVLEVRDIVGLAATKPFSISQTPL